ncbi:MAG TPA: DAK2 domain-containing protein [Gaiellaceae bacterium]|nr:DAK2 domain-containing protein [Gaiellaceae bacterium]
MNERGNVLELARAAETALDRNRARLDDLNVYPVPDGDTGTNMLLTVRAVREALEAGETDVAHAALLGARGNSGVILSQIIRGAVEGYSEDGSVATALKDGSDAAWAAVREPAEGTILTVIRALADEAEARSDDELLELLLALVVRGDAAVAQTQKQLEVLRRAGVVDAGAAGLVEILRGITAYVSGEPLPEAAEVVPLTADAIHQEASRYRYCAVFVVEGEALDRDVLERELAPLGDSLLVVGDEAALKAHVHTDDPGSALRAGTAMGVIERVEIANMHLQSVQREERLSQHGPDELRTAVVAVVTGEGNRRLFESMGATGIVDGGETMNPATEELLDAIEGTHAPEVVVLTNNDNVVLGARQAARLARLPVNVVPSGSLQAGLGAMLAYDPLADADTNAQAMEEASSAIAAGGVTVASRAVSVDGLRVERGAYLGLVGDEPVAGGTSFDAVAASVVDRLLAEPRDVLTLITGEEEPELGPLLARVAEQHPDLELEVHPGGQPHYPLLVSAE